MLGPLLGADGKPLRDDRERDAEGIALAAGDVRQGTAYISFERRHRIARYPFDLTDAAPLPDGGIVLLERRFRFSEGIQMRIRRIAAGELKRGTLMHGEVLLEANDSSNTDNMEAIAVHRAQSGETVLTLMSDDNFSPLQRTLIMQFTVPETKPVLAGPRG
jgi:hypothetical protein